MFGILNEILKDNDGKFMFVIVKSKNKTQENHKKATTNQSTNQPQKLKNTTGTKISMHVSFPHDFKSLFDLVK